jgi:hypothetical protein
MPASAATAVAPAVVQRRSTSRGVELHPSLGGSSGALAGAVAALRLGQLVIHLDQTAHERVYHLLLLVLALVMMRRALVIHLRGSVQVRHVRLQALRST